MVDIKDMLPEAPGGPQPSSGHVAGEQPGLQGEAETPDNAEKSEEGQVKDPTPGKASTSSQEEAAQELTEDFGEVLKGQGKGDGIKMDSSGENSATPDASLNALDGVGPEVDKANAEDNQKAPAQAPEPEPAPLAGPGGP